MDFVVPWLARWISLDLAARIFLGACVVLTLASVAFLHRTVFNQWSSHSLLAAFFVYHGSMLAGLANFSLGIGLVPAALAVWIRMQRANTAWRILVGCVMTLLLFFCHLVAIGAYGLLILGHTLAYVRDHWDRRDRLTAITKEFAVAGMTGLLPLMLFLRLVLDSGEASAPAEITYGNIAWKLKALLSPLANYSLPLDLVTFILLTALALISWLCGWLVADRRMLPGLVLLGAAFILAPKALWTGGVFDQRLAILLALMLVASTRFKSSEKSFVPILPAMLALLFLLRMGVLTSAWLDHRADLAEMHRAIDLVAEGGRILVVQPEKNTGQRLAPPRHRVFHHAVQLVSLPALAVIEKSAFVSTLYALPGQQPLFLNPPFDRLGGRGHVDMPTLNELSLAYELSETGKEAKRQIQNWPSDFDYIVLIYSYGPSSHELTGNLPLEPLMDGDILDLFRIVKD